LLNQGMVLLSDTRTNAGLDNISTYRKMFTFEDPGERVIVIMTAGSLSVTQTTIAQLREAIDDPDATPETSIMLAPTMLKVAEIVGQKLSHVREEIDDKLAVHDAGRQRQHDRRRAAQGRGDAAVPDLPGRQLHRGDRGHAVPADRRAQVRQADPRPGGEAHDQPRGRAEGGALSMDSTLRSNLSVGMPLDLAVIERTPCASRRSGGSRRAIPPSAR
jgi:putative proteasome-type protease